MLVFFGLFYPVFYLQLDAITHGVEQNFAFYSVRSLSSLGFNIAHCYLDSDLERIQCIWTIGTRVLRTPVWRLQYDGVLFHRVGHHSSDHARRQGSGWYSSICHIHWVLYWWLYVVCCPLIPIRTYSPTAAIGLNAPMIG